MRDVGGDGGRDRRRDDGPLASPDRSDHDRDDAVWIVLPNDPDPDRHLAGRPRIRRQRSRPTITSTLDCSATSMIGNVAPDFGATIRVASSGLRPSTSKGDGQRWWRRPQRPSTNAVPTQRAQLPEAARARSCVKPLRTKEDCLQDLTLTPRRSTLKTAVGATPPWVRIPPLRQAVPLSS